MNIDPRRIALGLCAVRIANGALLCFAPSAAAAIYLGPGGREPTARALARFTGARDLGIGAAALAAVITGERDAELVAAGAACEGVDFLVSILARDLSVRTRLAAPTAAIAAAVGLWAARGLATERIAGGQGRARGTLPS